LELLPLVYLQTIKIEDEVMNRDELLRIKMNVITSKEREIILKYLMPRYCWREELRRQRDHREVEKHFFMGPECPKMGVFAKALSKIETGKRIIEIALVAQYHP